MKLETIAYRQGRGWNAPFPPLDSEQTLVLVFGASGYQDANEPFAELRAAYPEANFAGCSSSGEILETEIHDDTLAVAVVQFEKTDLKTAAATVADASESFGAGAGLGQELASESLRGVFVLSDGLHVNGTELVRGLNESLGDSVVVTGGLAGDGDRFERTWVLRDGEPVSEVVVAIGFYGTDVRIGHGSKGGWDNFGPERTVTRSEGNVLYELDGKPALALYKEYLGERADGLPATGLLFPLAIRPDETVERRVVRTILAVDEKTQSMTFAGDLPKGWRAQLMKANFDRLIGGASDAAELARDDMEGPVLAVAISCVGRRLVLGERTEEEVEATLDALPAGTRQVGFYSYGEISPHVDGTCDLHNQTMTLTTIRED